MTIDIKIYKGSNPANISQLKMKRDWMNLDGMSHIYNCPPITTANVIGWGISFPEDISFIWDGEHDPQKKNVTMLSGEKYAYCMLGQIIRFKTDLMFKTTNDYTMCQMPVPNFDYKDFTPMSISISSSFFKGDLQPAIRAITPNKVIIIPANTQIFSVLPIDLAMLNKTEIQIIDSSKIPSKDLSYSKEYEDFTYGKIESKSWAGLYKKGLDENNEPIGNHQVKKLELYVREDL
jgi:hypothetical protein